MPLCRLLYYSRRDSQDRLDRDPDAILDASIKNNQRDAITGCMLAADGYYFQLMEGRRASLSATFARIGKDPRHHDVTLVDFSEVDERRMSGDPMTLVHGQAARHIIARFSPEHEFSPDAMRRDGFLRLAEELIKASRNQGPRGMDIEWE